MPSFGATELYFVLSFFLCVCGGLVYQLYDLILFTCKYFLSTYRMWKFLGAGVTRVHPSGSTFGACLWDLLHWDSQSLTDQALGHPLMSHHHPSS